MREALLIAVPFSCPPWDLSPSTTWSADYNFRLWFYQNPFTNVNQTLHTHTHHTHTYILAACQCYDLWLRGALSWHMLSSVLAQQILASGRGPLGALTVVLVASLLSVAHIKYWSQVHTLTLIWTRKLVCTRLLQLCTL